jgi:hypothetical protein
MKSEDYQELLAEYLEGDAAAEQELFARYDRGLRVSPEIWAGIEQDILPVGSSSGNWWLRIAAVILLSIGLGSLFLLGRTKDGAIAALTLPEQPAAVIQERPLAAKPRKGIKRIEKPIVADNPGVFSTELAFDLEEKDTAKHIEQTENLLRSIRNVPVSDSDEEIDVTYDKALSRKLLIENVVLRRDAEMKAKFPTKTLLTDLEPLLIDIANLPDHAKPDEVRAIKERVQKTEIVAALLDYKDRDPNNR